MPTPSLLLPGMRLDVPISGDPTPTVVWSKGDKDIEKGNVENDTPSPLPMGRQIFSTFPDFLFIFEIVFGAIMGSLIAATPFPFTLFIHGYVLAVCYLCAMGTLAIMIVYGFGCHRNANIWTHLDVYYHFLAAALYLSAGVVNAVGTQIIKYQSSHYNELNIAATGYAFMVFVLYTVHAAFSLRRKIQRAP